MTHPDLFLDKKYEKVRKGCDSRTLVGLARTQEVDDRFFSPFPSPDKYEVRYMYIVFICFCSFFSGCTSIVLEGELLLFYNIDSIWFLCLDPTGILIENQKKGGKEGACCFVQYVQCIGLHFTEIPLYNM